MRLMLWGSLALCLFLAPALLRGDDQADVKPVLDKALKAMGGEDKLARLKAGGCKTKITGKEGGAEFTATLDATWQGREQYRIDAEAQENGQAGKKILVVINGDKGWAQPAGGETSDAPKDIVPFVKNIFFAVRLPQMLPALRDKDFKLTPLGEVKVGNRLAVGVGVAHKDHKDVSLFFDKENGLPLKTEVRLTNPEGKDFAFEFFYTDWKEFGGIQHPTKVAVKMDDKEFTLEVSDVRADEKLDDSTFAKP